MKYQQVILLASGLALGVGGVIGGQWVLSNLTNSTPSSESSIPLEYDQLTPVSNGRIDEEGFDDSHDPYGLLYGNWPDLFSNQVYSYVKLEGDEGYFTVSMENMNYSYQGQIYEVSVPHLRHLNLSGSSLWEYAINPDLEFILAGAYTETYVESMYQEGNGIFLTIQIHNARDNGTEERIYAGAKSDVFLKETTTSLFVISFSYLNLDTYEVTPLDQIDVPGAEVRQEESLRIAPFKYLVAFETFWYPQNLLVYLDWMEGLTIDPQSVSTAFIVQIDFTDGTGDYAPQYDVIFMAETNGYIDLDYEHLRDVHGTLYEMLDNKMAFNFEFRLEDRELLASPDFDGYYFSFIQENFLTEDERDAYQVAIEAFTIDTNITEYSLMIEAVIDLEDLTIPSYEAFTSVETITGNYNDTWVSIIIPLGGDRYLFVANFEEYNYLNPDPNDNFQVIEAQALISIKTLNVVDELYVFDGEESLLITSLFLYEGKWIMAGLLSQSSLYERAYEWNHYATYVMILDTDFTPIDIEVLEADGKAVYFYYVWVEGSTLTVVLYCDAETGIFGTLRDENGSSEYYFTYQLTQSGQPN